MHHYLTRLVGALDETGARHCGPLSSLLVASCPRFYGLPTLPRPFASASLICVLPCVCAHVQLTALLRSFFCFRWRVLLSTPPVFFCFTRLGG